MPSSHLILCRPLLLLPPVPPSISLSNESTLRIRWPKYWRFSLSISPSKEHPGLIQLYANKKRSNKWVSGAVGFAPQAENLGTTYMEGSGFQPVRVGLSTAGSVSTDATELKLRKASQDKHRGLTWAGPVVLWAACGPWRLPRWLQPLRLMWQGLQGILAQRIFKNLTIGGSLDGKGVQGRRDTCICLAESLHCSPETITILLIGYTPIQNKKFKLKKIFLRISPLVFIPIITA